LQVSVAHFNFRAAIGARFVLLASRPLQGKLVYFEFPGSAVNPKTRSAPKFQSVMIPFKSFATIASSDESVLLCRRFVRLSSGSLAEKERFSDVS